MDIEGESALGARPVSKPFEDFPEWENRGILDVGGEYGKDESSAMGEIYVKVSMVYLKTDQSHNL